MKDVGAGTEWVIVRRCFRLPEAQIVRSILEAEGIAVLLPDEHLLGLEPGAETAFGGARVMVHAADLDHAQGILRAMDEGENSNASSDAPGS